MPSQADNESITALENVAFQRAAVLECTPQQLLDNVDWVFQDCDNKPERGRGGWKPIVIDGKLVEGWRIYADGMFEGKIDGLQAGGCGETNSELVA